MPLLLLLLGLAGAASKPGAPVTCVDPISNTKRTVNPKQITAQLAKLQTRLAQRGLHVLDLPDAVQERRRRLPQDIAAQNWCVVRSHLLAFEGALVNTKLDGRFVAAKFSRVERWLRDAAWPTANKTRLESLLAKAAQELANQKLAKANTTLNQVLGQLTESNDLWVLPPTPLDRTSDTTAQRPPITIESQEIQAVCPALAKTGTATDAEAAELFRRLAKEMDTKGLRIIDLKAGEELLADLQSLHALHTPGPEARVLCAMLKRVGDVEIGLSTSIKRFGFVNHLRDQHSVAADNSELFSQLVREASDAIAIQDYATAHARLETIFVLLGQPHKPSAELPAP